MTQTEPINSAKLTTAIERLRTCAKTHEYVASDSLFVQKMLTEVADLLESARDTVCERPHSCDYGRNHKGRAYCDCKCPHARGAQ